ncbi:MAG: hypothetical protein JWO79_2276 [Actinomycetia bacterium]|nr:hypothetical protein [Actinomycetes bacterium]
MTRDRGWVLAVVVGGIVLGAGVTGCSGSPQPGPPSSGSSGSPSSGGPSGGQSAPAPSQVPSPAPGGSGDPQNPTDTSKAGWISGILNADPRGDCYTLTTDDGDLYAIYHPKGGPLHRGQRVRAHLTPATVRIVCGEGRQVAADQLAAVH